MQWTLQAVNKRRSSLRFNAILKKIATCCGRMPAISAVCGRYLQTPIRHGMGVAG